MDALTIWHVLQFAVAMGTLGVAGLFFYDIVIASAGKAKLVAEAVAFVLLGLTTVALGIGPPAPPTHQIQRHP
jgi:hypothetical protein